MKTRNILRLLFIASLIIPAACGVKDPIFNTPHPDHGTVTFTTDWSGIGEGLTAPESYTVAAAPAGTTNAGYTATLTGVTNRLDHLFAPGTYRFLVHNTAEHITVSGTTATVATPGNDNNTLHALPGWLFSCALNAAVTRDSEHTFTAPMQQQVRLLTLVIEPRGGTADKIESITATLSGIASTLNLADGTHASPCGVPLAFSRITDGSDAGKWIASVRLLGISGTEQKLTGTIRFTDEALAALPLESDLSTDLKDFNADKREPLMLDGETVEMPTETGFTATIDRWIPVSGSGTAD